MGYLSNVKKLYCISWFHSLIPAYIIERLFWQQRGMNVQMVVYCEIIYAVTVSVCEIPSGILADKFGRKKLLAIYNAFAVCELIILLFAHSFWQFAGAVFLAGIGKALSSGSENALLYDSLACADRREDFEKQLGRISAIDFSGTLIAALSGSVLANYFKLEYNYVISIASMLMAFLLTLSLKEPPVTVAPEIEMSGFFNYAKQSLIVFRSQPLVLAYCLTGAVLGACMTYLDEFWTLVLESIGVPMLFFGAVSALEMVFKIPGGLWAYKLKEKFSYKSMFTCIIIINVVCYIAIFATRNVLCIIPMVITSLVAGVTEPLTAGYLHHHTESNIRATVESFSSLGLRIVSVCIGLLFGYISATFSIFAGFLLLGIICLSYFFLFIALQRRSSI